MSDKDNTQAPQSHSESDSNYNLLKDERLPTLLAKMVQSAWKQKVILAIVPAFTFLGGMFAIWSAIWIDIHDRRQALAIQQATFQIERVRGEKQRKITLEQAFNKAGLNMRGVRNITVAACQAGLRKTPEQQYALLKVRLQARMQLIATFYGMEFVFKDTPGLTKHAEKLEQFDESIKDYCTGPSEKAWRAVQTNISNRMEKSIFKSDNELKQLETQLSKLEA